MELGGFTPRISYCGIGEDLGLRVRGPINDFSVIISGIIGGLPVSELRNGYDKL